MCVMACKNTKWLGQVGLLADPLHRHCRSGLGKGLQVVRNHGWAIREDLFDERVLCITVSSRDNVDMLIPIRKIKLLFFYEFLVKSKRNLKII